ncbi:hypothetical protein G3N55_11910, partial [Dissulfurirhabdus thermomarina]
MAAEATRSAGSSRVIRYGAVVIGLILWYALVWDPLWGKMGELETADLAAETKIARLQREERLYRKDAARVEVLRRRVEGLRR